MCRTTTSILFWNFSFRQKFLVKTPKKENLSEFYQDLLNGVVVFFMEHTSKSSLFFRTIFLLLGPPYDKRVCPMIGGPWRLRFSDFLRRKSSQALLSLPLLLFLWRPGSGIECEHNLAFKTRLSILWLGRDLKGHWLLHTRLSIFWILTGSRRVKNRWFGGRFRKLRPFNVVPFFSLPTWWVRGLWQPFKISYGSFCVASSCFNYSTMGVISCD